MCLTERGNVTPPEPNSSQLREAALPDRMLDWLHHVDRHAGAAGPVLPANTEAARLLDRLGVDPDDAVDTLAARPDPVGHPVLWWALDRAYHDMLNHMGTPAPENGFGSWPALPIEAGAVGRHLYVWLYLAILPHVRHYHAERGVPDDISWSILADLGKSMNSDRILTGMSGLDVQWALPLIFRGVFYRLGRLAFNSTTCSIGQPLHAGEIALNTHIPSDDRLYPAACDESFVTAREFFSKHFPQRPVVFTCHSWLMDDQLAEYLPADSNLVRFQRRFSLLPTRHEICDRVMLQLVFHRRYDDAQIPESVLSDLPQDTTLQRAYVCHLRSGRRWYARTGWMPVN